MIKLFQIFSSLKISTKPDITRLSTYYFQSTAEVMITLQEESDLLEAFDYIQKEKLPYQILGKGSNVVLPPHYDGVILLDKISPLLATLKRTEWTGLPGTISGAVYGNAGIPGCEI
ncbi:MAG: hypothetical protein U9Q15_00790 [Patescibacteria group bacterium]|nr:hypothetical protein [Patescibacteria group bacterium]